MVCPLQTVLDDSIGCAIWFAARGLGKKFILNGDNQLELKEEQYKSRVKVISCSIDIFMRQVNSK